MQHLIRVVIPLEATNTVPAKAPCNLPMRPDTFTLGTKSADLIALDNSMLAREEYVRLNALIERNILEDIGYGDQLIEMQENSWPLERIRNGIFEKIDMCFEMDDTGETILQWCQGTVVELVKGKEQQKYIDLKIKWDDSEQGDSITTIQRLTKSNWNNETHVDGTWRENLRRLVKTSEDIFN